MGAGEGDGIASRIPTEVHTKTCAKGVAVGAEAVPGAWAGATAVDAGAGGVAIGVEAAWGESTGSAGSSSSHLTAEINRTNATAQTGRVLRR